MTEKSGKSETQNRENACVRVDAKPRMRLAGARRKTENAPCRCKTQNRESRKTQNRLCGRRTQTYNKYYRICLRLTTVKGVCGSGLKHSPLHIPPLPLDESKGVDNVRKNVKSKYLECAKKMPPLKLKVGTGEFDVMKSEVAQWLVKQPDILLYVINRIKGGKGQSPFIVYSSETRTWQGVDYDGD